MEKGYCKNCGKYELLDYCCNKDMRKICLGCAEIIHSEFHLQGEIIFVCELNLETAKLLGTIKFEN